MNNRFSERFSRKLFVAKRTGPMSGNPFTEFMCDLSTVDCGVIQGNLMLHFLKKKHNIQTIELIMLYIFLSTK